MENQGYNDIENERKANRIRELRNKINKGNNDKRLSEEAEVLSNELKNYLLEIYPDRFNMRFLYPSWKEYDKIISTHYTGNKEYIVNKYNLKRHDVIFFLQGGEGGSGEYKVSSGFLDDGGFYFASPYFFRTAYGYPSNEFLANTISTVGPEQWYEFLERMALLPNIAANLYNRRDENANQFYEDKRYYWPYVVSEKNKL